MYIPSSKQTLTCILLYNIAKTQALHTRSQIKRNTMEKNPAYRSAQNYTVSQAPSAESIYELMDLPATNEACTDKKNTAAGYHEIPKVDKTSQGRFIVGVIVAVLALVVAVAAITATVVLSQTDNYNQEIQTLKLQIENLREMLNQTGDNSNQEIQFLQLEIENLKEILNQTGDNSSQEIQSLQLEIGNLREMLNQTGDNSNQVIQSLQLEIGNLREMLNQTGDNSSQEIQSLQLEIENLREVLNQTADSLVILRTDNQDRDRKNILKEFSVHVYSCMIIILWE